MARNETQLAWLAGLIDGEGSVGITSHSDSSLAAVVQVCMTHEPTIRRAIQILRTHGIPTAKYTYQEKKAHHKDAHHFRVVRIADVKRLADLMMPFAVTKLEQWKIVSEFCSIRITERGLNPSGQVRRGGDWRAGTKSYSSRERALAARAKEANKRGKLIEVASAH